MKKIISIILTLIALTFPAFAADWDDNTKATLQGEFSHIFDPFTDKDVNKAMSALPPGFIAFIAKQHNVTAEQLEPSLRQLIQAGFEAIKSMKLDYDPTKTEFNKVENGELYALIPYKGHAVTTDDETMDTDSLVFAFKVNDQWYFVDLENPVNIEAIKNVYPQFKDAHFALGEAGQ